MATNLTSFKMHVAADVLPCPDPIIEREILNTIIEFCRLSHVIVKEFEVDISDETPATPCDKVDIDLSSYITDVRPVSIIAFNLDGVPKYPQKREFVNDIASDIWENISDDSYIYFYFYDNTTLRVYDRDTSDESLYVAMAVKPVRTITTIDDFIYEDYLDTIVAGVKWRIMSMPGKEWSNPRAAQRNYIEWRRGCSKVKAMVMKSFSKIPIEVHPRTFGNIDWDA